MGLIKKIGSFLINFSIFFLIVTFSPGLPPKTTFPFEEFSIAKTKALEGRLAINSALDNAEQLFPGKMDSPENLQYRDGIIYASLRSNQVVKTSGGKIGVVTDFGKSCYNSEVATCGRPIGMAFDTIGENLIVMHSSDGVFEVDMKTGKQKHLVSNADVIGEDNPRPCKLFNSVAVARNGDLFFSHSSSEYEIDKVAMTALPNPSGRLIHYSRATGKTKVLLDKIFFANGVALSPAEDFVVVSDTFAARLIKVWLKGDKKGQNEVFIDGLPGVPDNLSFDDKGIWVALATAIDEKNPMPAQVLASFPLVRKFLARLLELIKLPFSFVESFYPNSLTHYVCREFMSMDMIMFLIPPRRTIIRLDWDGNIVKSLHGSDNSVGSVTHALVVDDELYMGSVTSKFIARVKIPQGD